MKGSSSQLVTLGNVDTVLDTLESLKIHEPTIPENKPAAPKLASKAGAFSQTALPVIKPMVFGTKKQSSNDVMGMTNAGMTLTDIERQQLRQIMVRFVTGNHKQPEQKNRSKERINLSRADRQEKISLYKKNYNVSVFKSRPRQPQA